MPILVLLLFVVLPLPPILLDAEIRLLPVRSLLFLPLPLILVRLDRLLTRKFAAFIAESVVGAPGKIVFDLALVLLIRMHTYLNIVSLYKSLQNPKFFKAGSHVIGYSFLCIAYALKCYLYANSWKR